ncbi:hypothetical protein NEPAR08_2018 [Nematocida parisii]|nr:hypothetical protein NEPAR08_2018 [Nematocida parisii]
MKKQAVPLIILTIMLSCMHSRISLVEMKGILSTAIEESHEKTTINPDGPLNPLYGYIYHAAGYVHNKRFFSPEIKTDYTLRNIGNPDDVQISYEFNRKPAKDKACPVKDHSLNINQYLYEYHTQLIKMFPSPGEEINIAVGRNSSFTKFLRSENAKPYTAQILASLLLLSEGVNIPIGVSTINQQKMLILYNRDKTKVHFRINMRVITKIIDDTTCAYNLQGEAINIIKFFVKYKDTSILQEDRIQEPSSVEEFRSGKFLNTPRFLIQMYIHEFIDTEEDYIQLAKSIYTLLNESLDVLYMMDTTLESANEIEHINDVLKKYFTVDLSHNHTNEYICDIEEFENILDTYAVCPFIHFSQLPVYTRVPMYIRKTSAFIENQIHYYSNCAETAILSLFFSLAYNPESRTYTTASMPNASSDLSWFFNEHSRYKQTINNKMHRDWCKVVADLPCENICYIHNRNEIKSGIINFLYTVIEITGESTKTIKKLQKIVNDIKISPYINSYTEDKLTRYLNDLFKRLSCNKEVTVTCKNIKKSPENNQVDVFGTIEIKFSHNNIQGGIGLSFNKGHTYAYVLSSAVTFTLNDFNRVTALKNKYESIKKPVGYAIIEYITKQTDIFTMEEHLAAFIQKEQVQKIIKKGSTEINEIFVTAKISSVNYKIILVTNMLIWSITEELSQDHPVIRLVHNLLGSVPLHDQNTREEIFSALRYIKGVHQLYPNIDFPTGHSLGIECDTYELFCIFSCILDMDNPKVLLQCLCKYMTINNSACFDWNPLTTKTLSERIFNCIFSQRSINILNRLQMRMLTFWKHNPSVRNWVNLSWLIYACNDPNPSKEFILAVYKNIDLREYLPVQDSNIAGSTYTNALFTIMNMQKDFEEIEGLNHPKIRFKKVLQNARNILTYNR